VTGSLKFLIAATITLAATEVAVRLILPQPGFIPFPIAEVEGVFRPDSVRGYAYSPHFQRHVVTPNYTIDFQTNALGMRDEPVDKPTAPGTFRILAVGDSFTQGHGVNVDQAWPRRLQALLANSRIYNAGVSGYSLAQMNQTARELIPRLHPNLLALGLYVSSYYRMRDPFVLMGNGAGLVSRSEAKNVVVEKNGYLVSNFGRPVLRNLEWFLDLHWYTAGYFLQLGARAGRVLSRSHETSEPPPLREKMAPMLQELLASKALADSAGIPMVVLLINPQNSDGSFDELENEYNDIVGEFAAAHGIDVADPLPRLEALAEEGNPIFRLNEDRHWSPTAHAIAAQELAKEVATLSVQ
jgi:hypothetical protein